ncbi:MAG: hypothetical protein K2I06_11000 [Ruminococcus sp.]|nr:hypothetical protein [Ruminococcus sp.]
MDYHLDIVISEKNFLQTGIKEVKFWWGGEEYCHTPRRFETEDSLILKSFYSIETDSIIKSTKIYMPVVLTSSAVYDLKHIAYCCPEELVSHNLMKFLKRVSGLEKFIISLCGDDETIDYSIKYTGESDISEIIYNAFVSKKSVLIYK